MAREAIPRELTESIARLEACVEQSADDLARNDESNLVAPGVVEGLKRNVEQRIERLERRIAAGVKRRGNESLRDAAIARGALYPFGLPQERALNFVPLFARYGDELIAAVEKETRQHAEKLA